MKNILNGKCRQQVFERLERLISDSKRQWGKMTKEQVICHMADQLRIISGDIDIPFQGNLITRTLLKRIVLLGVPAPPEKIDTAVQLDYTKNGGTPPTSLEQDKEILVRLISEFIDGHKKYDPPKTHGIFGDMSREQWGRMVYVHMHHHLKQFNV
ncbi:MAG: DUF1569 domain-containing protein [Calditrichia bacterium]